MVLLPGVKDAFGSDEYLLDRDATARKRAGDWAGAIDALRQRKALMGEQWADDKLAKYLQQAGRFDEAMEEVRWLLEHSQAYASLMFGHRSVSTQQSQHAGRSARLHAAAALICGREGRADLQAHHEHLAARYGAIRKRLEPLARTEMKAGGRREGPQQD